MRPCDACDAPFLVEWWHRKENNYTCCECRKKASRHKSARKFPEKVAARRMVSAAIKRGDLTRLPCLICGDTKSQAHHDDYKKPLQIKWLCQQHHLALHAGKISA